MFHLQAEILTCMQHIKKYWIDKLKRKCNHDFEENTNEAGHKVIMAVGYTESSDGKKCPFFLSSHSIFKIDITVIKRLGY